MTRFVVTTVSKSAGIFIVLDLFSGEHEAQVKDEKTAQGYADALNKLPSSSNQVAHKYDRDQDGKHCKVCGRPQTVDIHGVYWSKYWT